MPITLHAPPLILAEHFPTPRLALRTTDPARQEQVRRFSAYQARAANRALAVLTRRYPRCGGQHERVAVLLSVYDLLARWRYETAAAMGSPRAERFRTPIVGVRGDMHRHVRADGRDLVGGSGPWPVVA